MLLDPRGQTVVAWLAWRRLEERRYRAVTGSGAVERASLGVAVGEWVARLVGTSQAKEWRLCVEGLFVVRGGKRASPTSALALAEAAGRVMGVCEGRAVGPVLRPMAREWRPAVLGIRASTPAKGAEDYAVRRADIVVGWPDGFPGVSRGGMTVAMRGHLAEAACIARWGATCGAMGAV